MEEAIRNRPASEPAELLETMLRQVPFFQTCNPVDAARLVGALELVEASPGNQIFPEGAPADGLYLLEQGRVAVTVATPEGERSLTELEAPAHFGELGLLLARRTATVHALTNVRLWKLPRVRFEQVAREHPSLALSVAIGAVELLERNRRELVGAPIVTPTSPSPLLVRVPPRPRSIRSRLVGAALAIGVPLALWPLVPPSGLDTTGWHILLILLGATIAWLFEPLPEFVIALLMAAAWGVTGLVSPALAFSGFATSTWVVSVGAFAVAIALAQSGLLFRTALWLLRTFPATHTGQVLALMIGGVLITPLMPLVIARVAAVMPLAREIAQMLGHLPRSSGSAALGLAGLIGYGMFSSVFLTGMIGNFFVLSLFPAGAGARFDWLTWLTAAIPAGLVLLVGSIAVVLLLFRPEQSMKVMAEVVRRQQRVLGSVSRTEWVTLGAIGVLVIGLLAQPLLNVDAAWLAIGALAVLFIGRGLDRERFRASIEWGLVVFFGVLLGAAHVLQQAGIDRWIGESLVPISQAVGDPGILVLLLGLLVVVSRLVLTWVPALLLLSLAMVPAAPLLGLSPWIAGFVVLLVTGTWVLPSQNEISRLVREGAGGELMTDRDVLLAGLAVSLLSLIALAVSVPYWRAIGLLGN